jgi:hypothetical protein
LPKDVPDPIIRQNDSFDVEDKIPLNQLLNTGKSIGYGGGITAKVICGSQKIMNHQILQYKVLSRLPKLR